MKKQTSPDGGNADNSTHVRGIMTRRTAIAGGMGGLLAGILNARDASGQAAAGVAAAPQPLMQLGGLCEGRVVKLNPADSISWVENMMLRSVELRTFRDYFTKLGMSFILSRAKVYMQAASTVVGPSPMTVPGIVGVLPSFVQVNRSDAFHDAVGLLVDDTGYAYAGGVRVSHNPFAIQSFTVYDLVPGTTTIAAHSINASDLQTLTVKDAATKLGQPPIIAGRFNDSSAVLPAPDRSAILAMTYQMIMNDSYARPLYPLDAFKSLLGQTPLVQKFGEATFQRYATGLGQNMGIPVCCCCNGCTCCVTINCCKSA